MFKERFVTKIFHKKTKKIHEEVSVCSVKKDYQFSIKTLLSRPRGVIAEGIPKVLQGVPTPAYLGYPLSVFNKNSTLKERMKENSLVFFLNPSTTRFSD